MKDRIINLQKRKREHLFLALKGSRTGVFDKVRLETIEPSNLKLSDIDTSLSFLGEKIDFPHYINAITGGGELSKKINKRLCIIASDFDIPIMTGSMNYYLKTQDTSPFKSFLKNKFVIANLSTRNSLDDMKRVTDFLKTPFIALHINTLQELLQIDGDNNFTSEIKNIEDAVNFFGDKLIIKAVGQGLSKTSIKKLLEIGIKNIDISGSGGTDFSIIEAKRRGFEDYDFPAISTYDSIKNFISMKDDQFLIASGGIDSPLDMVKALALGSNITASAHYFLRLVYMRQEQAYAKITQDRYLFKIFMLASSSKNLGDLKGKYFIEGA